MIKKLLVASFLLVLMWVGCKKTEEMMITPSRKTTLVLNFSGLQPLANNYSYEGWAIINSQPVSTGKFNVNSSGALISTSGQSIPNNEFMTNIDLSNASTIVITIEPANDTDPGPSATHYLAGNVSNGLAILTVGAPQALGNNFSTASGKYVLATPTDGMNNNEKSGIWFLDLSSGSPAQSLQLPLLPAGWKYEGWAVFNGKPLSTGTFTNPAAPDEAAPYSGTLPAPPFPGEDFIRNAPSGFTFPLDLSGGLAVITIEPSPDDSPAPFTLKPLLGNIPTTAADHVTYSMSNQASTFPTGAAAIK